MYDEFSNSGQVGEVVTQSTMSDKSKATAALLCFFLGTLGIHRFYLGRTGSAVAMLLLEIIGGITLFFVVGVVLWVIVGFWVIVDFIRILAGGLTDGQGRKLR